MKPKVPKCCSLTIQASSGRVYDTQLSLCGQTIFVIGNSTFNFLGTPMTVHNSQGKAQEALLDKLQSLLLKVNATELRLYKDAACPASPVTCHLHISLPIFRVVNKLEPLVTRFLKRWIIKSAC